MRILVLAKRHTSGKDSVKDNFGRVIKLFEEVAKKHGVTIIEADHLTKEGFNTRIGRMEVRVVPFSLTKMASYYRYAKKTAENGNYDLIYATSHPIFGGIGIAIAKLCGKKFGYDVQDNYDAYTRNPILRLMSSRAVKKADIVSCASNALARQAKSKGKKIVVTNGYDPRISKPIDKRQARKKLKLPQKAKIVAYTGSAEFREPEMLLEALEKLKMGSKDVKLLFVGSRVRKKLGKRGNKDTIFMDAMPHEKLNTAINAADVLVMPYPKNKFTEAMLAPYKLAEYMACGKPIVLSDVGEMSKLAPRFVFRAGDVDNMANKIEEALKVEKVDYGKKASDLRWSSLGKRLTNAIEAMEMKAG